MKIDEKEGVTFTRSGEDFRFLRNAIFTKQNKQVLRRKLVEAVKQSFFQTELVRALYGQQRAIAEKINGLDAAEIRNLADDLAAFIEVGTEISVGEVSPNDGAQKIAIAVSFQKALVHARLLLPPTFLMNYLDIQQARKLKELFDGQGRAEFVLQIQYSCPEESQNPSAHVICIDESTNAIINAIAQNQQVFQDAVERFLEEAGGGA